jgi:hypothetical protein
MSDKDKETPPRVWIFDENFEKPEIGNFTGEKYVWGYLKKDDNACEFLSIGEHQELLRIAKAEGLEREAKLYEAFANFIYEDREECRGDEDCDHCAHLAWAQEKREKAAILRNWK